MFDTRHRPVTLIFFLCSEDGIDDYADPAIESAEAHYVWQYFTHRANETGLLTGSSTQRSETGWILQALKSLAMFTQTAKWLQQLVMLTSSRCLHGIIKIFRPSERVTARILPRVTAGPAGTHPAARVHDARDSRPGRRPCGSNVPLKD